MVKYWFPKPKLWVQFPLFLKYTIYFLEKDFKKNSRNSFKINFNFEKSPKRRNKTTKTTIT